MSETYPFQVPSGINIIPDVSGNNNIGSDAKRFNIIYANSIVTTGSAGSSGYSGYSGVSGYSGYTGVSGFSGYTGVSGYSGGTGSNGASGLSGFSGYSGLSGATGAGTSGLSGFSGYSGQPGTNGSGSLAVPASTTNSGIAIWSGTAGAGLLSSPVTLDLTNLDIVMPSGWGILPVTAYSNDIGNATLPFNNVYATGVYSPNYNNAFGFPLNGQGIRQRSEILPLSTTSLTVLGPALVSSGTISHPAVTTTYGYMANWASTAALNAGAGPLTTAMFTQSSGGSTTLITGYNMQFRFALPDSDYANGNNRCRMFFGMTDQTLATMTNSDNPAGNYVGLQYCRASGSARQDTGFVPVSKNNTTQTTGATTLFPGGAAVYDLYLQAPPTPTGGTQTVYWWLNNVTSGLSASGSITATLPLAGTFIKAGGGAGVQSSGTLTAKNIRMAKLYCETYI
jgi:hypothetical protein